MIEIPKDPQSLSEMQALWAYQLGELVALRQAASCGAACTAPAGAGSAALPLVALVLVTPLALLVARRLRLASQPVEAKPLSKPSAFLAAANRLVRSALDWLKSGLRAVSQRAQ